MPLLYHTVAYSHLGQSLALAAGLETGTIENREFPDGEHYRRVITPPGGKDVVLVGGTIDDTSTLEIYDLGCSLVRHGARSLTFVVPYFGYSTMERAVQPGEVVTAKNRARLLSSIPMAEVGNRLVLVDLHAPGLPYYFEGNLHPFHLYAKPLILEAARELGGNDYVLASTDAGRAKWVESLANNLGVDASFIFKRRLDGGRTEVMAMNARVGGRRVVIYDDMIRTGSSLIEAARSYREAGASGVCAIATHGVFPGDSLNRIRSSGQIDMIVTTDTHPRARQLECGFLKVLSIANVIAGFLNADPAASVHF